MRSTSGTTVACCWSNAKVVCAVSLPLGFFLSHWFLTLVFHSFPTTSAGSESFPDLSWADDPPVPQRGPMVSPWLVQGRCSAPPTGVKNVSPEAACQGQGRQLPAETMPSGPTPMSSALMQCFDGDGRQRRGAGHGAETAVQWRLPWSGVEATIPTATLRFNSVGPPSRLVQLT